MLAQKNSALVIALLPTSGPSTTCHLANRRMVLSVQRRQPLRSSCATGQYDTIAPAGRQRIVAAQVCTMRPRTRQQERRHLNPWSMQCCDTRRRLLHHYRQRQYHTSQKPGPRGGGADVEEIIPDNAHISGTRQHVRPKAVRFLNPWVDLANVTPDDVLAHKVDSVTRTFGLVAALMCSLSAVVMFASPEADEEHREAEQQDGGAVTQPRKTPSAVVADTNASILNHFMSTGHTAGTSLLLSWGLSNKAISDAYIGSCAGAFYSSVCAMGLSAVVNAWLAATPPGGTRYFVRQYSLVICSIPGFLALATGLAGTSLFIGLDRSNGTPVSYIGLVGTGLGGIFVGSTTLRGMISTYRLLTPLVRKLKL